MLRRTLPYLVCLMLSLVVSACSLPGTRAVQSSDPVLERAQLTYSAIRTYRAAGTVTMSQGQLRFVMDHVAPDRFRLQILDAKDLTALEIVAVGDGLYGRVSDDRWELVDPASEVGSWLSQLIQRGKMQDVSQQSVVQAGEQVVQDSFCVLYKRTTDTEQIVYWVTAMEGVVLKTEVMKEGMAWSYTYDNFNHPMSIEVPVKGLFLP